MRNIVRSSQFKKDWKKLNHILTDANRRKFLEAVSLLQKDEKLPPEYLDHPLVGNFKDHRDCHIAPDLILIYRIRNKLNDVQLVRIGSHSVLF